MSIHKDFTFQPENWKEHLTKILSFEYNPRNAHIELAPYRNVDFIPENNYIESAVGVHLFFESEPQIILIERPLKMRKHAGQIAFPGGKKDAEDKSLLDTALRESKEELGILPQKMICIGSLSQVYIPVSNFMVHSFVFVHFNKPNLFPNKDEVNEVLKLKLSHLIDNSTKSRRDIVLGNGSQIKNSPCFKLGDKIIWGATGIILNELKWRIIEFHQQAV